MILGNPLWKRSKVNGVDRRRSTRAPVALHQNAPEAYASTRDDRRRYPEGHKTYRTTSLERGAREPVPSSPRSEHDRHRRPREKEYNTERDERHHDGRHRHERNEAVDRDRRRRDEPPRAKERDSKIPEGIAAGLGGSAAATLLSESLKDRHRKDADDDEDSSDRRRRRRREGNDHLSPDGERTRNHEAKAVERERKESGSYERSMRPPLADPRSDRDDVGQPRRRHHHRASDDMDESDTSDSDYRPPRDHRSSDVRVVSPPKNPEPKPKGILRPPRERFPEDPAPIREGVAPLKDAGAKGVPPNARWTKIDRRLVNPDALKVGKERFEERPDYVIVLRVLSKEEIEAYAAKTTELRSMAFPGAFLAFLANMT